MSAKKQEKTVRDLPSQLQEDYNAATVYVRHCQQGLDETLHSRDASTNANDWEHIQLAYGRLDMSVKRQDEIGEKLKEARETK